MNIETINITTFNHPSRRLIQAIANAEPLKKLTFRCWTDDQEDSPKESLGGIINQSLTRLNIYDEVCMVGKLLKVFLAAEVIHLEVTALVLDLSNIPNATVDRIQF